MKKLLWLAIIALIIPSIAWGIDVSWSSHEKDRSIYYLGMIFGQVGVVVIGQGGPIIGELLRIFNIAVLSVGTIVVVYSVIISTLTTAQEGEVMGKKWSSIWIPIRSAAGLALMLPTASGYSLIQILLMWVVLQGVHGANQIWTTILDKASQGLGITSSLEMRAVEADRTVRGIFSAAACAAYMNSDDQFIEDNGGLDATIYPAPNNLNQLWVGIEGSSTHPKSCGVINIAPFTAEFRDADQWRRQQLAGAELAYYAMVSYADEALLDRSQWTGSGIIVDGMLSMRGAITNVDLATGVSTDFLEALSPPLSEAQINELRTLFASGLGEYEAAYQDGWIHAGSYYYKLVAEDAADGTPVSPPTFQPPDNDYYIISSRAANLYTNFSDPPGSTTDSSGSSINITGPSGLSDEAEEALGDTVSGLTEVMLDFVNSLSTSRGDPLLSFQTVGTDIMNTVEIIFFAVVIGLPILMALACVMSGTQPACYVLGLVILLLFPLLMIVLALLWSAGVMLGIYIPMIPYLVFTFTAMGWLLLVVETIVAAPIVALGITAPGHEALGKASPAVLLITNVFLRPSLILIGFIASARLIQAVIGMLNYGFELFIYQNVDDLMVFGNIAAIVIYAGIAVAAVHQTFSLTYVLADKVIRWIGGQAEQSMVEKAMEETKKASEQAAESTSGVMKGAGEAIVEKVKSTMEAMEKGSEEEGGGGKGGKLSLGGDPPGGGKGGGMGGGAGGGTGGAPPPPPVV